MVFIGIGADTPDQDIHRTPLGNFITGVTTHAVAAATAISGYVPVDAPRWMCLLMILGLAIGPALSGQFEREGKFALTLQ